MNKLVLVLLALVALLPLASANAGPTGPDYVRYGLDGDMNVPPKVDSTLVPWATTDASDGITPVSLNPDGSQTIQADGTYDLTAHMDWNVPSQGGMRRMEVFVVNADGSEHRLAAMCTAKLSGDGYGSMNSGPVHLVAGDQIVTKVRQNNEVPEQLQDFSVTFLDIQYLGV